MSGYFGSIRLLEDAVIEASIIHSFLPALPHFVVNDKARRCMMRV